MQKLILVMTSRLPSGALKPRSKEEKVLLEALNCIDEWEAVTGPKKVRFPSYSTALGLRVTLKATLDLTYLTQTIGYKYPLTSRLSQDPIKKLFGIICQFFGCNNHPTSAQFLTAVNCLSFYNLVKAPDTGNCAGGALMALVGTSDVAGHVDTLLDSGKLEEASKTLKASSIVPDHVYPEQTSDARLLYYLAGYVARRKILTTKCRYGFEYLLTSAEDADKNISSFTAFCDNGGLLYPSQELFSFIGALEDSFTLWFSWNKLHRDSISEVMDSLHNLPLVGCTAYNTALTSSIVKFFMMTRLHFYTKSLNKERASKREKKKHFKLRRVT
ncbi:hypothetical protein HPB48_010479 [Haemaphysalis longicornis]|uniref:Transposable element P transposase-like RNase H C-terminal domain-containing protein n=1 Tax=Haemaphysalis longicornis TaxID=44386 RepID=A0A9J6FT98_HAELO|nr:hypothetical protein HPB48_010479 [Haemaphysalis longicornis]